MLRTLKWALLGQDSWANWSAHLTLLRCVWIFRPHDAPPAPSLDFTTTVNLVLSGAEMYYTHTKYYKAVNLYGILYASEYESTSIQYKCVDGIII